MNRPHTFSQLRSAPFPQTLPQVPSTIQAGFWLCIFIGIAAVLRRALALQRPLATDAPPDLQRLDAFFTTHVLLTYVHILAALVFVCVLPFVFWSRTRASTTVHLLFYTVGTIVGFSAFGMVVHPVGGAIEGAAVIFYNGFFLVSLAVSYSAWQMGQRENSLRWTLRATAISLGIATTRPIMGIFFATSRLTHWTPEQFFGPAFWVGFSINTLVMELWLRKSRSFRSQ
jgi:hypothetical protein